MKKQRKWVKWAAIGFFAAMLLLTFFSGTIRNLTLPQITAQAVVPGTVTPVVACSGITETRNAREYLAAWNGEVTKVLVKTGDRVKTGDVLLRIKCTDDGTLTVKRAELAQKEAAYQEALLTASVPSDSGAQEEYQLLQNNLEDAQQRQTRCLEFIEKYSPLETQLSAAKAKLEAARTDYHTAVDAAVQEAEAARQVLETAQSRQENAQINESYYAVRSPGSKAYRAAKKELDEASAEVFECQNRCYVLDTALRALNAEYQPPMDAAQKEVDALKSRIVDLTEEYVGCTDARECENAVLSAKSAVSAWNDRQRSIEVQETLADAHLAAMEEELMALRQEITGLSDGIILADCDGIVSAVPKSESFASGDLLASVRTEEAFTLRCSVPLTDAAKLQLGVNARPTNQSGSILQIKLTAIEPDTADPTNQKCLVFTVTGDDAAQNQYISLNVDLETSRHDTVVPNAAMYRDSMGDFVYVVETKTTPLGSRSKVRRVGVEVLRQDDRYTAVTGDLDRSSYVVIMSSAPLSDGQAVRFGD